jgi:SAM-dependent methyltransferase
MIDYSHVTELAEDDVSAEQVERLAHRYIWAGGYCHQKDVLEIACGAGQGLGYLSSISNTLHAGDITPNLVSLAQRHYGQRVSISEMDAQSLPFSDHTKDVIILFEAIYYIPDVNKFVQECLRVLRPGGTVLIATANKDLFDFNPSPHSHQYFGVVQLNKIFAKNGFAVNLFGHLEIEGLSIRQRIFRPIKYLAVRFNLIPSTMAGKKLLKKLVFGKMIKMPAEIDENTTNFISPKIITDMSNPNEVFKVIYCEAKLRNVQL